MRANKRKGSAGLIADTLSFLKNRPLGTPKTPNVGKLLNLSGK